MGESSRRKKTDPLYGKVRQDDRFRGIVISNPMRIEGSELFAESPSIDPGELRFSVLFWDELVWPSSRTIFFESTNEEKLLEAEGVLSRPDYTVWGDAAQGMLATQVNAFREMDSKRPGMWSLAQGEKSLLLLSDFITESGGLDLDLLKAIPVPKNSVPVEEILEFKRRRYPELIILRNKVDSLVSRIESAESKEDELKRCLDEIDKACSDLLRCSIEWQWPIYLSDLSVSFNYNPVAFAMSAIGGMSQTESLGLEMSLACGAIVGTASSINISKGGFGLRSIRRPASPFRYAHRIQTDLG